MDANEINAKLESLYYKQYRNVFRRLNYNSGIDYSEFLLKCYDEYLASENIRILYVLKDTTYIYRMGPNNPDDFNRLGDIDMYSHSLNTIVGRPSIGSGRLTQGGINSFYFMHSVNKNVNPTKNFNYLCTEIFKINSEKGRSINKYEDYDSIDYEVFKNELKLLNPTFVIFITGKTNDKYINNIYDENFYYLPNEDDKNIAFIRSDRRTINNVFLRLPLLNRKSLDEVDSLVEVVTKIILNSSISYYNKLKDYESKQANKKHTRRKLQNS